MSTATKMHYAGLHDDYAACGVDIRRGGWTKVVKSVTCKRCLTSDRLTRDVAAKEGRR